MEEQRDKNSEEIDRKESRRRRLREQSQDGKDFPRLWVRQLSWTRPALQELISVCGRWPYNPSFHIHKSYLVIFK